MNVTPWILACLMSAQASIAMLPDEEITTIRPLRFKIPITVTQSTVEVESLQIRVETTRHMGPPAPRQLTEADRLREQVKRLEEQLARSEAERQALKFQILVERKLPRSAALQASNWRNWSWPERP